MKIDYLRKEIEDGKYLEAKLLMFGGAGIVINSTFDEKYAKDEAITYYCTEDAKYYVWLIEKLKDVVAYDYLSKYEYYGTLLEKIKEVDKMDLPIKDKLLLILESVDKRWLNK